MGPARVHVEAVLFALLEDRRTGSTIVQLTAATERTHAQVRTAGSLTCARSPPRKGFCR
ncbi:hypothetical protein [Streptomyces sp. NPDC005573]|uniref:hypothetical protein n=1 Tax=Streptomyces sp. NPDC005573 TaxID=3156890 RepID=UPI0033A22085